MVVLILRTFLLLSNNLAARFSYLFRIVSVVVEGEVLLLDLELPLPDDEDLAGNISLLEHYLILDEGFGLKNEVDDFEELSFGPHTKKR